ncbi:histidinol-phosphate transaminase [Bacillus sp. T3]|uniref:histidinol-phosphate transaminase n=1 Tax=Bacillus sp. T3 TaxID=467262 RepID=UPI002981E091|nr:histidinol-phosphate transaminase [Bacillus sp. T3]
MNRMSLIEPRKSLSKIKPYLPGKPIWEVQKELGLDRVIKLASNENPIGPSPKAIKEIGGCLTELNRYPDANATNLKNTITRRLGLNEKNLIITNGADELITLVSETFLEPGVEIIVPSPSFSEYDFGANLMGANVVAVPLGEDFQFNIHAIVSSVTEKTKLVYICSPNNPTGTYLPKNKLDQLLTALPKHILVVFDSAYSHFATAADYTDGIEFVKKDYPIIVLQTFSKIYGLAGLRVGFGISRESIINDILKVKEPFNVNSLAQAAATAAITDEDHVEASKEVNRVGREQLYHAFDELKLKYYESMSNFVLVELGPKAKDIYHQLMAKGIIVRYGNTWGMPEFIRISVGTSEENATLIDQLKTILNH